MDSTTRPTATGTTARTSTALGELTRLFLRLGFTAFGGPAAHIAMMKEEVVNCHPLSNDATTSIASADLIRFMEATGHKPLVLKVTA